MAEIDCGDFAATVTYDDYLTRMFNSLPIVEVKEEK